jgi:hypothetical protein
MSHKEILARVCTALAFSLSAPTLAHAMQQSISSAGVPYVSGGGTEDERQFLKHMQTHYSAWLITRNRATGSALAGAHLRIIDTKTGASSSIERWTIRGYFWLCPKGAFR